MDVRSIAPGEDFAHAIAQRLVNTETVLVLIDRRWLGDGQPRRIDDADDLFRIEIATALQHGLRVVPILINGSSMPAPSELPSDISELARLNAARLHDESFEQDVDRLIRSIKPTRAPTRALLIASVIAAGAAIVATAIVTQGKHRPADPFPYVRAVTTTAHATTIPNPAESLSQPRSAEAADAQTTVPPTDTSDGLEIEAGVALDASASVAPQKRAARVEQEPNDTRANANLVIVGARVQGYITDRYDNDWYKLTTDGSYRHVLTASVTSKSWGFGPGLIVEDSNEKALMDLNFYGQWENQSGTVSLRPNSDYYVRVYVHSPTGGHGDYTLSLLPK